MEIIIGFILLIVLLYFLKKYMSGPNFLTQKYDLTNKYAVITGGNSGIGKETFLQLVRLNCNVIIGARDKKKNQQTIKLAEQILNKNKSGQNVIIQHFSLDLGSKKSIDQFTHFVNSKFPKIDYLINNAGLSLIPKRGTTVDGFQTSYGVNHLGHFYLTYLLMEKLSKAQLFRIINVSSIGHRRILGFFKKVQPDWSNINFTTPSSYQQDLAYSRSKLYNILFTKSLSIKIPTTRGLSLSLHPGVVRSDITRHVKLLQYLIIIFYPIYWLFTKSCKQGAQTILFTVLNDKVQTGGYYADCEKSQVNQEALKIQNQEKLWQISQKDLGIKFQVKFI